MEAQVIRERTPPNQSGLLDLSQDNFPDLTRPPQKLPPQKSPRRRNNNIQQNAERISPRPSQNTSQPQPQRTQPRNRAVPKVVLHRLDPSTLTDPEPTGTKSTQSATIDREKEAGNANTTETTSTQEGAGTQEANTSTPKQPRINPAPHGNKTDWTLEPRQKILIFGDSNLARIPTYTQDNLQIESYAGMKVNHAAGILEKTDKNEQVSHCIISVGINDRTRNGMDFTKKELNKIVKEAKRAFPCASIFIPLINYSTGLAQEEKHQLDLINQEIKKKSHIPKLDQREFKTDEDNIHWLPETASAILTHWLCCLN